MQNAKVEIILDRKRYLFFNFNAWCAVTKALDGAPLTSAIGDRALLYGGLLHEDPRLTLQQAGDFFDLFDREMIAQKVEEAIEAANAQKAAKDKSPNVARQENGTGASCSIQPAASV